MPNRKLFHNPRCSKSRQAVSLIQDKNVDIEIVEYLKTPLTIEDVTTLFEALDIESAHKMIRPKEAEFGLAKLHNSSSNSDVLAAIAKYPKLLERPILLVDDKAAIGRPPENILMLIK